MNSNDTDAIEDYNNDEFLKNLSALPDDEYIEFVADFLRPTKVEFVFVGIYLIIVSIFLIKLIKDFQMLIGITGNSLVVYVVLRNKAMVCNEFCQMAIRGQTGKCHIC
jgi:hypothetical protein